MARIGDSVERDTPTARLKFPAEEVSGVRIAGAEPSTPTMPSERSPVAAPNRSPVVSSSGCNACLGHQLDAETSGWMVERLLLVVERVHTENNRLRAELDVARDRGDIAIARVDVLLDRIGRIHRGEGT